MTIIFFTRALPNRISDELTRQGHAVFESLSISETVALQEQHPSAAIVINRDVQSEAAKVVQQRYPTLQLNPSTTTADILWELNQKVGRVE